MTHVAARRGPGCPSSLVALRRLAASVLLAVMALGACAPAPTDEGVGAFRHGKHLSRPAYPALIVRTTRRVHADSSPHRRGGAWAWTAGTDPVVAPTRLLIARLAVRSVDTLPGHWAARHLII